MNNFYFLRRSALWFPSLCRGLTSKKSYLYMRCDQNFSNKPHNHAQEKTTQTILAFILKRLVYSSSNQESIKQEDIANQESR